MVIDTHVHVGQFYDNYFSPKYVLKLMQTLGVDTFFVSSTTICEENYEKVICEMEQLVYLDSQRAIPVMWVTPEGLKGNIAWYLESNVTWKCVKIHPFLHRGVWEPSDSRMIEVVEIAKELDVPLLIHTGNDNCCNAGRYEPIIKKYPEVAFILAHGRPADESVRLMKQYENVYVDSAFMDIEEMLYIVDNGKVSHFLWGSDMCIPIYFSPYLNCVDYYNGLLKQLREHISPGIYNMITYKNAKRLFKLDS